MSAGLRPVALAALALAALVMLGCSSQTSKPATRVVRPVQPRPATTAEKAAARTPTAAKTPVAPRAFRGTPDELLRHLQKTYAGFSTLRVEGAGETVTKADGKLVGKPRREAVSLVFKRPRKLIIRTPSSVITADGKYVYTYIPEAKRYARTALTPEAINTFRAGKPGVGLLGLLLGADYSRMIASARALPDEKIGRRDVYVMSLAFKPKPGAVKGISTTETLWIGKSDMGLYRSRLTIRLDASRLPAAKGGGAKKVRIVETTITNELTSFQPGIRLPDSTFAFKPPAGARLVERPEPVDLLNKPAPDLAYVAADGTPRKLSDLRGKVVVLDFWALPMCEKHLPLLQSLSKSDGIDVELVLVNLNPKKDAVSAFLKSKDYTFPVVFADQEIAKVAGEEYGLRALPTMLVLDKNGIVRAQFLGEITADQIAKAIKGIR